MEITIKEFDHAFYINFTPQNAEESSTLARLGLLSVKHPTLSVSAGHTNIYASMTIKKQKQPDSSITFKTL
ncbi:MAG: hypothetical protein HOP31_12945 [Ignavibacteria bacterium]|nr:hypothetical protein [Ignavibacteria bacterium]